MVRAYRTVVERVDLFDPYYMPVDSPYREDYLTKLKELEPGLSTDWGIVASKSHTHGIGILDLSPPVEVVALTEAIAPFLSRFYDS